jgi:hypothetical protein
MHSTQLKEQERFRELLRRHVDFEGLTKSITSFCQQLANDVTELRPETV